MIASPMGDTSKIQWILNDFRASAVPDRLTHYNVDWIEGDYLVEIWVQEKIAQSQKVTTYITQPARRLLDKYQFMAAGGWIAYGCDPEGQYWGEIPYFKPVEP